MASSSVVCGMPRAADLDRPCVRVLHAVRNEDSETEDAMSNKLMTITVTIESRRNLRNDEDIIEVCNDLENLFIADKIKGSIQSLLDEHDLADRVTLTVEE
jgi:hypothetical protein